MKKVGNENGYRILAKNFRKADEKQQGEMSEMERMARDLGANVVTGQNVSKATHMVMPKLGRTMAFLCGITYVKYIVSSAWIEDSHKEKKFSEHLNSQTRVEFH